MTVPRIITVSSSATAASECKGQVLVSGSYGGEYNGYHAAKWGIRGVVLCDAGVGKDDAGIKGLAYLDRIGLAAATADAETCHIADGEHMLEHGRISHVNEAATALGCAVGQSVLQCAELMTSGPIITQEPPAISGGKRSTPRAEPGEPRVVCLDAAPMMEPSDAGQILITGSHAALFRGQSDGVVKEDVLAIFFSDAGVGLNGAGIARLSDLDLRAIPSATASASSARIGDAQNIYEEGVLSHVNRTASHIGIVPGMTVKDAVCPSSNDLRLFGRGKIGVSGSVFGLI